MSRASACSRVEAPDGATTAGAAKPVGAESDKLLTDAAVELLFRVCRGIPRIASRLLRAALKEAHARNQNIVDDSAFKAAVETLTLVEEVKL